MATVDVKVNEAWVKQKALSLRNVSVSAGGQVSYTWEGNSYTMHPEASVVETANGIELKIKIVSVKNSTGS